MHIDEIRGYKFFCFECGKELIPVLGNIRDHHFRHKLMSNCQGNLETEAHIICKKILKENGKVLLEDGNYFFYDKAEIEMAQDQYRPDVILSNESGRVMVEIVVTNDVSDKKFEYYESKRTKLLIIHISRVAILTELTNTVLNDPLCRDYYDLEEERYQDIIGLDKTNNKTMLHSSSPQTENEYGIYLFFGGPVVLLIIFFRHLTKAKFKHNSKKHISFKEFKRLQNRYYAGFR